MKMERRSLEVRGEKTIEKNGEVKGYERMRRISLGRRIKQSKNNR